MKINLYKDGVRCILSPAEIKHAKIDIYSLLQECRNAENIQSGKSIDDLTNFCLDVMSQGGITIEGDFLVDIGITHNNLDIFFNANYKYFGNQNNNNNDDDEAEKMAEILTEEDKKKIDQLMEEIEGVDEDTFHKKINNYFNELKDEIWSKNIRCILECKTIDNIIDAGKRIKLNDAKLYSYKDTYLLDINIKKKDFFSLSEFFNIKDPDQFNLYAAKFIMDDAVNKLLEL